MAASRPEEASSAVPTVGAASSAAGEIRLCTVPYSKILAGLLVLVCYDDVLGEASGALGGAAGKRGDRLEGWGGESAASRSSSCVRPEAGNRRGRTESGGARAAGGPDPAAAPLHSAGLEEEVRKLICLTTALTGLPALVEAEGVVPHWPRKAGLAWESEAAAAAAVSGPPSTSSSRVSRVLRSLSGPPRLHLRAATPPQVLRSVASFAVAPGSPSLLAPSFWFG